MENIKVLTKEEAKSLPVGVEYIRVRIWEPDESDWFDEVGRFANIEDAMAYADNYANDNYVDEMGGFPYWIHYSVIVSTGDVNKRAKCIKEYVNYFGKLKLVMQLMSNGDRYYYDYEGRIIAVKEAKK